MTSPVPLGYHSADHDQLYTAVSLHGSSPILNHLWEAAQACSQAVCHCFVQRLQDTVQWMRMRRGSLACREELETYDAFDEGVFCRSRSWLFISYVVSFASVIAAVWVLLQGYALGDVPSVWPGAAGVLQVRVATPSCRPGSGQPAQD